MKPAGRGWKVLALTMTAVVVIALLGGAAWWLYRDKSSNRGAGNAYRPSSVTGSPEAGPADCPVSFEDDSGDTRLMYTDRPPYGRADIVGVQISCADESFAVAVTFASGVDMSVTGFQVSIDVETADEQQWRSQCPQQDGDDFSMVVDAFDASTTKLLSFRSCEAPYPTVAQSTSTTDGVVLSGSLPYSDLNLASGSIVSVQVSSTTFLPPDLIDPGQDQAPDSGYRQLRVA